jgi:hypothetical protein
MTLKSDLCKNDIAWNLLFGKYHIIDQVDRYGFFEISATQINEFREARLMTKFDHRASLPDLFSKNDLAILPVTRGTYVISRIEAYKVFEQSTDEVESANIPDYIQSIDYENITSEAMAINCAYVSEILADFLEDEALLPTVSGRMSSASFSFIIWNKQMKSDFSINVVNSQVEIDGGYEGIRRIALIEAKNYFSDDFLIRQLYYPYRLWTGKVQKQVIPIFLVYSNGVFSLYEYQFSDPERYNSLTLVKQKNYSIEAADISLEEIVRLLNGVQVAQEPEVSFPQANDFKRIINLCELLLQSDMIMDEITQNYAFDRRQTNYYTDAGRYLGLISKNRFNGEITFSLTDEGRRIIRLPYKSRQLKFVEKILEHRAFNETLKLYLKYAQAPPRQEVIQVMHASDLYQVEADSTFGRRASTIISWINWILHLQK